MYLGTPSLGRFYLHIAINDQNSNHPKSLDWKPHSETSTHFGINTSLSASQPLFFLLCQQNCIHTAFISARSIAVFPALTNTKFSARILINETPFWHPSLQHRMHPSLSTNEHRSAFERQHGIYIRTPYLHQNSLISTMPPHQQQ